MRYKTICLLCYLITSCGRPVADSDGWSGTVDTLESGRVVIHNPDVPSRGWSWELRESFRLGAFLEEGPELFGQIAGLELDGEGRVYVLDGQASEIRVFGRDGAFLRSFGQKGEGPGELENGSGLAFDSQGTLWVLNWGNGRYSGFDPVQGEAKREPRRRVAFASFPWRGEFEGGGRLVDVGLGQDGNPAVLRLDTAFAPTDTLVLPEPSEDDRIFLREGSVTIASVLDPFAPRPVWAPRPAGGILVSDGSAFRVHRVDFTGDTVATMELARDPAPTTRAERDSAVAAIDQMAGSLGGVAASRRPNPRATKPAHGQMFVDDQDRTWVQAIPSAGGEPSWEVFGPGGKYLGPVAMPDAPSFLPPVVRGNRMSLATQVQGIPVVVVYDLVNVTGQEGPGTS